MSNRNVFVAVVILIAALYAGCSCLSGGTIEVERDVARRTSDPRVSGESCHVRKISCDDHWSGGGGCSLWTFEVDSPGSCDITFDVDDGPDRTTVTRRMEFRTLDGCMCSGSVAGDAVPAIGAPDARAGDAGAG